MTLTEVMIAAALMGAVALITAKLMGDQTSHQAYLKSKAEIASMTTVIENFLNHPERCSVSLKNKIVGVGAPVEIGTSGSAETLLGYTLSNGAQVETLVEKDYGIFSIEDGGATLQKSIYGASISDLVITFTMKGKFLLNSGRTQIQKRFPIVTQLDAANKIISCGPMLGDVVATGQEKLCEALGGAAVWDGTRCVLNDVKCPYGTVATKMTSLGGIICTPLVNQVKLDEIFDLTTKDCTGLANIQINSSGNKIKVDCF